MGERARQIEVFRERTCPVRLRIPVFLRTGHALSDPARSVHASRSTRFSLSPPRLGRTLNRRFTGRANSLSFYRIRELARRTRGNTKERRRDSSLCLRMLKGSRTSVICPVPVLWKVKVIEGGERRRRMEGWWFIWWFDVSGHCYLTYKNLETF